MIRGDRIGFSFSPLLKNKEKKIKVVNKAGIVQYKEVAYPLFTGSVESSCRCARKRKEEERKQSLAETALNGFILKICSRGVCGNKPWRRSWLAMCKRA